MAEVTNYSIVMEGIDKAIAGLREMNEALDAGLKIGRSHAVRMNALNDRIDSVAKAYSEASVDIKSFLSGIVEASSSILDASSYVDQFEKTFKKSLIAGGTQARAFVTASKKVSKALQENQSAAEAFANAERELAEAQQAVSRATVRPRKGSKRTPTEAEVRGPFTNLNTAKENLNKIKQDLADANKDNTFLRQSFENQKIREEERDTQVLLAGYLQQKKALEDLQREQNKLIAQAKQRKEQEEEIIRLYGSQEMKDWADAEEARQIQRQKSLEGAFTSKKSIEQGRDIEEAEFLFGGVEQRKQAEDFDAALDDFYKEESKRKEKAIKDSAAQAKAEEKLHKENLDFFQKELSVFEASEKEKLALAKKFLDFQHSVKTGATSKDQINRQGAASFLDIAQGEGVVKSATGPLASEIDRYRASLDQAALAQKRLAAAAKDSDKTTKEFTLSWQTMGRIVVAQAFNEVFFGFQNAIRTSIKDAEELYKAIAEIQTIVDRSAATANNFNSALTTVIDTSSKINFTPSDTANAFYETLSNQIGDSVNQLTSFIEEAGNLGKVTRATLADSADAITAVMNSYNMSISDAHEISADLFTMVDQGRLKLEEVANHMGNVSVPASQLGVDFKNVTAALSAISIAGIPARESMTLLRNVMFKLIDPTEAMAGLFQDWGVASADAAVATFGFDGVIQKLGEEALKGNERIAELMGTIRGTRGVLGLTSENYRKYTGALAAAEESQRNYTKIVEEYLANPGEDFSKLIQQTSNEILVLGTQIVSLTAKFANFVGQTEEGNYRLAELTGFLARFTVVAGSAGAAFLTMATAWGAVRGVLAVLSKMHPVLAGITTAFTLLAAGASFAASTFKTAEQRFGEVSNKAIEANQNVAKAYRDGIIAVYKELEETVTTSSQKVLLESSNALSEIEKKLKEIGATDALEDLRAKFERLIKAFGGSDADQRLALIFNDATESAFTFGDGIRYTSDQLRDLSSAEEGVIDRAEQYIDKLREQRNAVLDLVSANRLSLAQSMTERNIAALDPSRRGQAQFAAAQDAARQAANVSDPEESKRLFEIARKFLSDAESSAFSTGFFGNIQAHTQFFNQQEAALNAAQERRLSQEVKMIDQQAQIVIQEGERAQKAKEGYEIELRRRDVLKEQYELQLAFLEEYQRRVTQINTNADLSTDQKLQEREKLDSKTSQGLEAIGVSPEDTAAFMKSFESRVLQVWEAEFKKRQEDASRERSERLEALKVEKQEKELLASKLEEAGSKIEASAQNFFNATKEINEQLSAFNIMAGPDAFAPPVVDTNPEIQALLLELEKARADAEKSNNPEIFKQALVSAYERINAVGLNESPKTKDEISSLLGEFTTLIKQFEAQQGVITSVNEYSKKQAEELEKANSSLQQIVDIFDQGKAVAASSEEEEGTGSEYDSERLINFLDTNFIKLFNILTPKKDENKSQSQNQNKDQPTQVIAEQNNYQFAPEALQQQVQDQSQLDRPSKSRGQLIWEEQQARLQAFATTPSRGEQIAAEQNERMKIFAQERQQLEQAQQVIDMQRQTEELRRKQAEEEFNGKGMFRPGFDPRGGTINGLPSENFLGPNNQGPMINGRPAAEVIGQAANQPMIGGMPAWMTSVGDQTANAVSMGVQQSIPQAMQQGSTYIEQAFANALSRMPQGQGAQYFATGGPVGTDTIPAWLSPGEYVVNARATAQNFNWLQAINAGARPRYYAEGGPVSQSQSFTNTFNVVSSNPNAQVNNIVGAIRRQISQGKATLSKRRPY